MKMFKVSDTLPKNLDNKKGCYFLILVKKDKPKPIQRVFGDIDTNGILYIGKGDNLYKRVNSLQKSIISNSDYSQTKPKEKGHKALSRKFYRVRKKINIEALRIKIIENNNLDAEKLESYYIRLTKKLKNI
ncbi:MAG: hypothetical protein ACK5H1_03065 [Tenacibaculum sp.]